MKNRLLPLVFVLGCYSAYSQVGVGTLNPHEASKLQVFEAKHNKGILIPSVALTGTADATTVKNLDSDANSLLVYNTANVADVTEGYYYWTAADQKWNRIVSAKDLSAAIDSVGGINGIAGAAGAPGTPGAITTLDVIVKDPNGDIYAYVGTKTTAAERSTEWEQKSPYWVKINGLNGKDGIAGAAGAPGTAGSITTLDAIVKDTNGDIYAYVGIKTTAAERDEEWANKSPNWVKINGLNGKDGIAGASGAPGTAGSITTLDAIVKDTNGDIYAYVGTETTVAGRDADWANKSPNWVKINGLNGKDGIAGATGAPGTAGSITTLDAIIKDPNGDIYAYVGTKKTAAERDEEWVDKSPNWVKINGLNGKDGQDGIVGGTGAPGSKGETGYPGDNVAMYIDNATGIIYVRDPNDNDKWIALTGKNGIDGIAGAAGAPGTAGSITTLDAIVKDPNGDIYAYVGTDKTVAGRDADWANKSPNWVKINGLNGKDGIAGASGAPGTAGSITTLDAIVKDTNGDIYAYVGSETTVAGRDADWANKSPNWVKINGLNGKDGIAGATGAPGTAGSITTLDAIIKDPNGDIYAYVGTKKTVAGRDEEWVDKSPNWVKINGLNGKDGQDGIVGGTGAPGSKGETGYPGDNVAMYIDNATGIIYVRDPNDNDKWIALTGKNGIDGIAGASGAPGTPGAITTLDAIVKDPNGDIFAYVGTDKTVEGRDTDWAQKSPNWVKINGLNGTDGIPGATGAPGTAGSITTLDAIVKDPNGDIYAYVGTEKTVAGRDAEWAAKSPNWVKINGINGKDGIAGASGAPGTAGSITTLDAIVKDTNGDIYAYVGTETTVAGRDADWANKSPNWVKINGINGNDGIRRCYRSTRYCRFNYYTRCNCKRSKR